MKWSGNKRPAIPSLKIAAAITAGVFSIFALAGCQHKSVEDSLAAGDLAMQNTKLADAESDYQAAVAAAPNDPRPYVALGNLYAFEQKPSQAEAQYTKALELDPHNTAAHEALGNIFVSQSEPGHAEEQFRAAVAIDPVDPSYRINLAGLLQKQGKLGEAEAQLRAAIGLDGKNAHAHLALANLLSADPERSAEAQAEFAEVRALDPSLLTNGTPAPVAAPAPTPSPVESPETTAAPPPPAPASAMPKVRPLNRKFLLAHDSPVYDTPQESGNVVAQVHRRKFVRVTGITGKWLRVQLKNGTVGYIPASAAE
jgi:tetratricopeptide (TPR) repeat protein